MTDRYRTSNYAIVRVICACGHFDTVSVLAGHFVTVDGTYVKCEPCQRKNDCDRCGHPTSMHETEGVCFGCGEPCEPTPDTKPERSD